MVVVVVGGTGFIVMLGSAIIVMEVVVIGMVVRVVLIRRGVQMLIGAEGTGVV